VPRTSEVLFSRDYWLGDFDARVPALFRIALGALVVADLGRRLGDFHALYTTAGLATSAAPWPQEVLRWSLFHLTSTPGQALAVYLFAVAVAVCFLVGYRTRVANVALWVLMVSVFNRNPYVCDGGDAVVLALLFWSMFSDLGARLSLDVALGRRAPGATVAAAPLRFMQLQVAYIYLVTFLAKAGPSWRDGTAVLLAVGSPEWGRGLGPLLAAHPALCAAFTWGTLAIEAIFPLAALSPWRRARAAALAGGVALHVGIFLTLRVGIFSQVMPVSYLLFVPAVWLDAVVRPLPEATPASTRPWQHAALIGGLAIPFAAIVLAQVWMTVGFRPAGLVARGLRVLAHHQNWNMFSPDPPTVSMRIEGPGLLSNGAPVDAVAVLTPAVAGSSGFPYQRWHKLRQHLRRQSPELLSAFGRFICRRYGERPGSRLERFTLRAVLTPVPPTTGPTYTEELLRQNCVLRAGHGSISKPGDEPQDETIVSDRPDLPGRQPANALKGRGRAGTGHLRPFAPVPARD
jgi:hypothetical protein